MTFFARRPPEQVDLHPAPPGLQAWCLCAVVRRVHAGPVHTRIQASTWASVNVLVEGEVHDARGALPARFLTAPFTRPLATVVPGSLRAMCLVLQPWALAALAETGLARLGPGPTDASQTGSALAGVCEAMSAATRTGALDPLWSALRLHDGVVRRALPALAIETLASEGVDSAAAAIGCSPRHYLRLFRGAMGLPPSSWVRVRRWEDALRSMASAADEPMADLSLRHGFADQAHLSRDTRALVDESPVRLRRLLHDAQGPWPLRPAHVRSVQDGGDPRA